ncbi:hypothetical protein Slala05_24140 [Streptomyces lavendulae subsp. lavendulae]|nr:hypothetical protein Slala05_24140 [Streptomyces lavendulae subsp. lavendulae]
MTTLAIGAPRPLWGPARSGSLAPRPANTLGCKGVRLSWVSFVRNLWKNGSGLSFDTAGDPTAYFWVHLLLAVTSFLLGTAVGVIGLRGVRALRRESR